MFYFCIIRLVFSEKAPLIKLHRIQIFIDINKSRDAFILVYTFYIPNYLRNRIPINNTYSPRTYRCSKWKQWILNLLTNSNQFSFSHIGPLALKGHREPWCTWPAPVFIFSALLLSKRFWSFVIARLIYRTNCKEICANSCCRLTMVFNDTWVWKNREILLNSTCKCSQCWLENRAVERDQWERKKRLCLVWQFLN